MTTQRKRKRVNKITQTLAAVTPGVPVSRPDEPVDVGAVVAARQRELYIEHLERKAIADATEVLERDGPEAAVDVLQHYADHITWLGGHID